jgi:TatD DNase family protein
MSPNPHYINVHTHHQQRLNAVPFIVEIVNYYEHFELAKDSATCSMGLHPWYIQNLNEQMAALEQHASAMNVLAIGECGLDKLCKTPWPLQQAAFEAQIQLANTLNKPLIIHCARAYSEVLQLLHRAEVPVIFHGFNKKLSLAREITDKGYYLSFGAALLTGKGIQEMFAQLPDNCFFLETDHDHIIIAEVYRVAASIRKTTEDVIILQLQQQYKNVFGT